jgi:integrase
MAIITRTRQRDGKTVYLVRLRIPGESKQYSKTFDSKSEAERYERNQLTDRDRGVELDPRKGRTSLSAVADLWLRSKPRKKDSSVERDKSTIQHHIKNRHECQGKGAPLGSRTISSITKSDVEDLVTAWEAVYEPSTVLRMYRTVQAVFTYALDNDYRGRTPCRGIRLPPVTPREAKILSRGELECLARVLGAYGPMVYIAANGPRWGEIAGLRVGAICFGDEPSINIADQLTRGKGGRMVTTTTKHRNSERTLSIPDWLGDMLFTHLSERGGVGDGDYVFVTANGAPLHYSNWRRRHWLPAVAKAGLEDFHFHDLRHIAGTCLDEAGVSDKVKEHRTGATKMVVERVYAQATDPADRAAADLVGEMFKPSWAA